jgi:heterotetrameric sarcosine oxidase gamma subunit
VAVEPAPGTAEAPPARARVVIIGGGVMGCSVAYHLAALGWTDLVLLEQGQLSCGTTWHAAGLVGQLRSQESLTRLCQYSTELYSRLEVETGLATGWKQCGGMSVARTPERMTYLKRYAAVARAFGIDCEIVDAREAGRLWPVMRIDDLLGAVWLPGDGKANPSDLTQALARGARMRGARIVEGIRVVGVTVTGGTVRGVSTTQGDVECEIVVNCAGQWAKQVGRMCGVTVPLHSAEHFYMVSGQIEGVHPELPVMRDPDGYIYFKEDVGALVMGGFEPDAKPWGMDGIPDPFEFQLLPDDWEQFGILLENALHRVPALEAAGVKRSINGPESFTPDNNFLLGEAPEVRNFYLGCGFNSMGIASAGGAGKGLAEWIVNGEQTTDLWAVDIRRFARFNGNEQWLRDRVTETLGLHYAMPWPNREMESARPLRRSPVYHVLERAGACFGTKMGWERANWFAPAGTPPRVEYSFEKQNWLPFSAAEHLATREAVALFDQTSFSKYTFKGRDAVSALQFLCTNDVDVVVGGVVYTGMLNERGGYESDFTVTRVADDEYLIVTSSGQTTRDLDYIGRHLPEGAHAVLVDVTSGYAVFGVMGPRSRTLLQRVSRADFTTDAFPFATSRLVDIGYATVRATRITYVGELGWELYVPTEFAVSVYDTLLDAGADLGLLQAGYYAIDSLRLEKGYRAWGRELTPECTPLEAGLGFACKLGTEMPFRGREALLAQRAAGLQRKVVSLVLDDPCRMMWGGELLLRDGRAAGHVTSAAYGHTVGGAVMLGYLNSADGSPLANDDLRASGYHVDIAGERVPATLHLRPPYDPASARVRS